MDSNNELNTLYRAQQMLVLEAIKEVDDDNFSNPHPFTNLTANEQEKLKWYYAIDGAPNGQEPAAYAAQLRAQDPSLYSEIVIILNKLFEAMKLGKETLEHALPLPKIGPPHHQ